MYNILTWLRYGAGLLLYELPVNFPTTVLIYSWHVNYTESSTAITSLVIIESGTISIFTLAKFRNVHLELRTSLSRSLESDSNTNKAFLRAVMIHRKKNRKYFFQKIKNRKYRNGLKKQTCYKSLIYGGM